VTHKEPQDVKKPITGLAAALGTIPVPIAAAMLLMVVLPYRGNRYSAIAPPMQTDEPFNTLI
jgi:hypothetical protein